MNIFPSSEIATEVATKMVESVAAPKAEEGAIELTVSTVGNHVYFYSSVGADRSLALMRALREVDSTLRAERAARDLPDDHPATPIWLHVYSGGGGVFAGFNLADQIKTIQTPIYSVVEGLCASAATLISMSCTRRYIRPRSIMMMHQIGSVMWGTYEQLKDEMKLLDILMEQLTQFYVEHSQLDAEKVREMLKRDTWLSAEEALAAGLVDAVLE